MLDPGTITDAIVSALRTIPELVLQMGGDPEKIYAHHYLYGSDVRLVEAVYRIVPPSILVVWDGTQGGNFDGQTIWKHRFQLHIRTANVAGISEPTSYEKVWFLLVNGSVYGGSLNIRQVNLLPELDLMEVPSIGHRQDEELMDYFVGTFIFPEIGDN